MGLFDYLRNKFGRGKKEEETLAETVESFDDGSLDERIETVLGRGKDRDGAEQNALEQLPLQYDQNPEMFETYKVPNAAKRDPNTPGFLFEINYSLTPEGEAYVLDQQKAAQAAQQATQPAAPAQSPTRVAGSGPGPELGYKKI